MSWEGGLEQDPPLPHPTPLMLWKPGLLGEGEEHSPGSVGWKVVAEDFSGTGCLSQPQGSASPSIYRCSTRKASVSRTLHCEKQPGQPRPQGPPFLPRGPGLGSWRSPGAEGACGCGVRDKPSKQPHPGGNINVHLSGTLKCLPWGDQADVTLHGAPGTPALPSPAPPPHLAAWRRFFSAVGAGVSAQ